jgi:hypothetical protein
MRAPKIRRLFAALLAVCVFPSPALAQAQSLGVVTAVTGVANLVRSGRQDAQSLQFKDAVFLKDLIRTGDKGLVRLLMGGKAVVTVREFTNLTITDDPGRPTIIEVTQGRVAVGVARARMKPGESIEIHTPNAIAGVRGTYLIVEVVRGRTAQQGGSTPRGGPRLRRRPACRPTSRSLTARPAPGPSTPTRASPRSTCSPRASSPGPAR